MNKFYEKLNICYNILVENGYNPKIRDYVNSTTVTIMFPLHSMYDFYDSTLCDELRCLLGEYFVGYNWISSKQYVELNKNGVKC